MRTLLTRLLTVAATILSLNIVTAAPPSLVLRSSSELVQLTVTATTKGGIPIEGLRLEDFDVSEDGKQVAISKFIRSGASGDPAITSPASDSSAQFSNDPARSDRPTTVLLLDQADTGSTSWELAWPKVVSFLRTLRPLDQFAVYSIDSSWRFQVLQDYGQEAKGFWEALQTSHPSLPSLANRPSINLPHSAFSFSNRDNPSNAEFLEVAEIQGLTTAFHLIADHLGQLAGPKSLIWFAGKFPDAFETVSHHHNAAVTSSYLSLRRAINDLVSNDIAIFPVAARGLTPEHIFDAENENIPIGPVLPGEQSAMTLENFSVPMKLASLSGGEAYFNTNGFESAFKAIGFSAKGTYTLGFYTSAAADNRFHALKVSVKRKGVHLRYRPGYWHFSLAGTFQSEYDLKSALASPFILNKISLRANAVHSPSIKRILVDLYVNPSNLRLDHLKHQWRGSMEIICGQLDTQDRVFATPPLKWPVEVPDPVRASGEWLRVKVPVVVRDGSTKIRIVVRDDGSGNIGSLDLPINQLDR